MVKERVCLMYGAWLSAESGRLKQLYTMSAEAIAGQAEREKPFVVPSIMTELGEDA